MLVAAVGAYINVVTRLFQVSAYGVSLGPPQLAPLLHGVMLGPRLPLALQLSLLTGLGALGLMVWLTATPHSRDTERKRLGMLTGFAFLTGGWHRGPPRAQWGAGVRAPNGSDDAHLCLAGINLGPLLQMCISINPR